MITIDGDYLEGGGQILRSALALSTITKKPFSINNIRKNRPQPGLKNQHMFCIKALQELSDAKSENGSLGSESVTFYPGIVKSRTLSINIETAGSITLLMQSLLMPCLFANGKIRLKITGGTDVRWAMPYDYFQHVLLPHIKKFCEKIDVKLERRGYYPKGNGKVDIIIHPKFRISDYDSFDSFINDLKSKIKPISLLEQGNIQQVKGISHASLDLQESEVAERQAKSAKLVLSSLNCPISIETTYSESMSTGSGIILYAKFSKEDGEVDYNNPVILGSSSLGERSKRSELVGKEAAEQLIDEINSKAAADRYLADNLIPFMALIGKSIKTSSISNHTLTNIYTVNKFVGMNFNIDKVNGIIKSG